MRNQEKVIVLFCFNMAGWCFLLLPKFPGETKSAAWQYVAYTVFNLVSAVQCHLWLTDKR